MSETKDEIYDRMCNVITDFEMENSDAGSDELYNMLVTIQNNWEDTITKQD